MRDLFDDLMARTERRDPWAEQTRDETPVEEDDEFPVETWDDEILVE